MIVSAIPMHDSTIRIQGNEVDTLTKLPSMLNLFIFTLTSEWKFLRDNENIYMTYKHLTCLMLC
jgi:hypothetical protein